MSLIYKTLFEIKLMHEYFLTRPDGKSVFEKNTPAERLIFLKEEFENDKQPINADIDFQFPESLKTGYDGAGLKLLPTYSGCRIVIRVIQKQLTDGTVVFSPAINISKDQHIYILLNRRANRIDSYTNSRVQRALPCIYYFSNTNELGPRTFPYLTNSVPDYNSNVNYEQGEISFRSGKIQEYFSNSGADTWADITGTGFVNESDRILLPPRFNYSFENPAGLTEAEFRLKDNDGNEVLAVTKTSSEGLPASVDFDVSEKVKQVPPNDPYVVEDFLYTLDVTTNNGYSRSHSIMFADNLVVRDSWAMININASITGPFNLFAADGFLIRRKDPLSGWAPAPVFEIPVKSRLVYWRFRNNQGRDLGISPPLIPYVHKESKVLVTNRPRSLAKDFFQLRKQGSTDTLYVPNPTDVRLVNEKGRRLFLEISVPQSELFPVIL